ncbi:MAG: hypothetical protein F6J93_14600 [Oscillatoria sp. SIO1A7]|nr:hypothetical protein [Oscillatoria sp. SIO1A7]
MKQGNPNVFSLYLSELSRWLAPVLIIGLLATFGLGWLVNSILILIGFIVIAPAIGFLVLRWWIGRNLISGQCPSCGYEFPGFKNTEFPCPSCGESLKVENGSFQRLTPPGTIDVDAVEVSVSQIKGGN